MVNQYPDRIRSVLSFLENSHYPSLGPHLYILGLIGLWRPINSKFKVFKQIIFIISISFFITQYCRCLIQRDSYSFKLILKYAPFHVGIFKSCFFQKDQKLWTKLIFYTAEIERDQFSKNNKDFVEIINKYISYNRKITYFFWALALIANTGIFTEPYRKNQILENGSIYIHVFDGYTPFKREPPGYYGAMFIETILGIFVSLYVVGWDTLVLSIMIFYAGQLNIARIICRNIIDVRNTKRSHYNIAEFHRYYMKLIKYQKLFNTLIERVMFVYLIVISLNLGVCIIEIAHTKNELASLSYSIIFLVACLIQLLLFYWHANEVTYQSLLLRYAVFETNWTHAEIELQKEVALLFISTTKRMVFTAGPFTEMSLATFIAILRASYSFYTLMNSTN